jgi:hypothetical protein
MTRLALLGRFSLAAALWALVALTALPGQASPLDTVKSYRFLPSQSVLTETGGIYPRHIDYRVYGPFDFATHWPLGDVIVPGKTADFENVRAWASHPILAYVLPLDRVLNLSGLTGHQLPVASLFDVYQFKGTTQDGSSVNLYASVIGPWLHLRGGTTPPAGSADMLRYEIYATAHTSPFADYNNDGVVNRDDLAAWSSGLGKATPPGSDLPYDGAGLLLLQRQLSDAPPPDAAFDAAISAAIAANQTAGAAAVPEPKTLGLLALAGMVLVRGQRRRAR